MKWTAITLSLLFLAAGILAQEKDAPEHKEQMEHHFGMKELEAFHDLLHPLVHEAYPEGDFDTIRAGLDSLLTKAVTIQKATLPKKYASRKKEFQKQAKLLVAQLTDMNQIKDKVDNDILDKKFNEMHETFELLASLLMK